MNRGLVVCDTNILLCDTLSGVGCHCSRMLAWEPRCIVWAFHLSLGYLLAYPKASAELLGQWTLTTFTLHYLRTWVRHKTKRLFKWHLSLRLPLLICYVLNEPQLFWVSVSVHLSIYLYELKNKSSFCGIFFLFWILWCSLLSAKARCVTTSVISVYSFDSCKPISHFWHYLKVNAQ